MTKINIYDNDYKTLVKLSLESGDSIADIIEEAVFRYKKSVEEDKLYDNN